MSTAVLLILLFLPARKATMLVPARLTLVLANPVAHGARLGAAVLEALDGVTVNLVGDTRLADAPLSRGMYHFPSVTVRSFGPSLSPAHLWRALGLRRRTVLKATDYPGLSQAYLEVLFVLQAVRYDFAHAWVSSLPKNHLWLTDFDRHAYCRPLIWQAKKLGRKTATLVHGSPNQNYLPPVADQLLVWGEAQLRWFREASPQSHCHVVGRPEIRKSIASAPPRRLRVMHSMELLTMAERASLVRLLGTARRWGLECSLRPHPSIAGEGLGDDWKALAGSVRIEDGFDFLESLVPGDIVVGINSTAVIDALTVGVPAWTLADTGRELPCDLDKLREASIPLRAALLESEREAAVDREGASILRHSGLLEVADFVVAATGAKAAGLVRDTVTGMVP